MRRCCTPATTVEVEDEDTARLRTLWAAAIADATATAAATSGVAATPGRTAATIGDEKEPPADDHHNDAGAAGILGGGSSGLTTKTPRTKQGRNGKKFSWKVYPGTL